MKVELPLKFKTYGEFWRNIIGPELEKRPDAQRIVYKEGGPYGGPYGSKEYVYNVVELKAVVFDELCQRLKKQASICYDGGCDVYDILNPIRSILKEYGLE